jgi:FkbM family methyltransferase
MISTEKQGMTAFWRNDVARIALQKGDYELCNGAYATLRGSSLQVSTGPDVWSYSLFFRLDANNAIPDTQRAWTAAVHLTVEAGRIGVGVLGEDLTQYLLPEQYVSAQGRSIIVYVDLASGAKVLMFRNAGNNGRSSFRLERIEAIAAEDRPDRVWERAEAAHKESVEIPFLDADWDGAHNLPDRPVLPFVSRFRPRYPFEMPFDLLVMSARSLKNAYLTYKKTPIALFPLIQDVLGIDRPVYWDVGANTGVSTVQIGLLLQRSGGKVIAFECEPDNVFALQKMFTINGLNDSLVVPLALSESNSILKLNLNTPQVQAGGTAASASLGNLAGLGLHTLMDPLNESVGVWGTYVTSISVLALRADFLVDNGIVPRPDYVFIDAAMFEDRIVSGMEGLFSASDKPVAVLIEQTPGSASGDASTKVQGTFIGRYLAGCGYDNITLERYPLSRFDKRHLGSYFMSLFYLPAVLPAAVARQLAGQVKTQLNHF